ncbi:cell division protein FtsW [Candidatus Nomurabacteria bacterium]|nr:cell division protein FtsW [Candidatus Nomurabacteria bacterium]
MFQTLRQYWHEARFDKPFFWIIVIFVIVGLFIFVSASLSVVPKNPDIFRRMLLSQLVLGLVGGAIAGYITFKIPYIFWRTYALILLIVGIILTVLVFVPGISLSHGGATRWISLGPLSFQPAEILKIVFVMYVSAWYGWAHRKLHQFKYGVVPLIIMFMVVGAVLLLQPDTGTFLVIAGTGVILYFVSGAKVRDLAIMFALAIIAGGILVVARPYLLARVKTFMNPGHDPQGASYQVRQGFIALGSGGLAGRGYGQSIQKFQYLPEPVGDSVFAVAGEELGFVGTVTLVLLYVIFALRGLWIARRAPNMFARLLVTGLVMLVIIQAFLNITSIIGLFPLSGLPLIFVSHGGTSLAITLASMGIILSVSQYLKRLSSEEK